MGLFNLNHTDRPSVKNESGFTLIEIVLALGILFFVMIGVSSFMLNAGKARMNAEREADLRVDKAVFSRALEKYISSAVNVEWTSAVINDVNAGKGLLRKYRSNLIADANSAPLTLGLFLRDAGVNQSDIRATALYYKEPTPLTPGRISLATSTSGTGSVDLNSNSAELTLDSVVDFEIGVGGMDVVDGEPVRVVKLNITQRVFTSGDQNDWRWCPASMSAVPACIMTVGVKDVESFYYLSLNKNLIDTGVTRSTGANKMETIDGEVYIYENVFIDRD